MKILTRLYSIYILVVFILLFLLFLIPLLVIAQKTSWHTLALKINHYWAILFFRLTFIPYSINYQGSISRDQQFIICANHFSYLDIPAMGLLPVNFKFFGKSSLSSIPVFGYMYRKIHIIVNRSSLRGRKQSYDHALDELEKGFSLAIFPEGGIYTKQAPKMEPFKEGAFSLATEKKIPVLPITFLTNYQLLPDDSSFLMRNGKCQIVVHPPIFPDGNSQQSMKELKYKVYERIQNELDKADN